MGRRFFAAVLPCILASCGEGGGSGGTPPPASTSFTVTATTDSGGSASPASQQVPAGASATIALSPSAGYRLASASGCGGTLSGTTFTTGAVTAPCTVAASFALDGADQVVSYRSFADAQLTLYAWTGNRVVLLSASPALDRQAMARWLAGLDKAYEFYAATASRLPDVNREVGGRLTIAQVPQTCGAGCGYLGATGIEMASDYFQSAYAAVRDQDAFDQIPFYELGRNFWFYSPQLAYKAPDSPDAIVTGFAVFMRFEAMAAAGVAGAPFNGRSFAQFRAEVEGLIDQYLADPSYRWDNTLRINQGLPGPYGATDLFASFLFRLKRDHGGDAFTQAIWKEGAKRPAAATTQDAVDNFVLAASAAAGRNLTGQFETWRWPVSDAARSEARARFGPAT